MKKGNRSDIMKAVLSGIIFVMTFGCMVDKANALSVKDSTVYARAVYVVDWLDNDGKNRKFCLVKDADQAYVGIAQYLQYYDGSTLVSVTPMYIDGGAINGGFGSSVHHVSPSPNQHRATSGHILTLRYQGAHIAIFDWTQTIGGAVETITYTFIDGNDYFQWQETMDATNGTLNGDSRGPYCTIKWDGVDFSAATGCEYASNKYFSQPSYNGAWTFGGTADIPYVLEWDNNREIGYVQTQTFTQQLAGNPTWGGSLNLGASGSTIDDADVWKYDYQMFFYDKAKKITWGMPYGYMRGDNGTGTKNKWGQYSLSVVLDAMSEGGVKRVRNENRAIHDGSVALTANTGSVATQGYVGTKNSTLQTLSPAGYDHNYRAWVVVPTTGGMVDMDMTVNGVTPLVNPTFRVMGLAGVPSSVSYKGTTLTLGTDYYASHDASTNEVWVTIVRNFTGGASNVTITGTYAPIISDLTAMTEQNAVNIYPNPFLNGFTIETGKLEGSGKSELVIQNYLGEEVFSVETNESVIQVKSEEFAPGLYTVLIKKAGKSYSKKIVRF